MQIHRSNVGQSTCTSTDGPTFLRTSICQKLKLSQKNLPIRCKIELRESASPTSTIHGFFAFAKLKFGVFEFFDFAFL